MVDNQQLAAALSGTIKPTPRNPVLGGVADLLGMAYKLPEMPRLGVPGMDFLAANRNKVLDLLGMGDVQKTADALSYGNRVGTGAGMTYQPLPETLGAAMTVAPMVAPAARMVGKGAMETGRFVAPKAGQLAEQYMVNTGGILPLDVYHGSPHTFPPTPKNPLGEFDASKIGTGEGAQAYGHGIYTAENPAVAAGYRDKLQKVNYSGSEIDPSNPSHVALATVEQFGNKEKASAYLKQRANLMDYEVNMQAAKLLDEGSALPIRKATGNLYKVDLPDAKIAKMLDWDKPLSEQNAQVQKFFAPYVEKMKKIEGGRSGSEWGNLAGPRAYDPIGNELLRLISQNDKMNAQTVLGGGLGPEVSAKLRQAGIPGIKYLDEGSRSAGKGTRNFVVFPSEEKSMTILERNAKKP
jgi:hypothetical protein